MKKYYIELLILIIQMLVFYMFPLFLYLVEPIAMVMLMLLITVILSIILSIASNKRIRFLYPLIISLIFIPTVFIFYNESALVHALWYFVVSGLSMFVVEFIKWILHKKIIKSKISLLILILLILFGVCCYVYNAYVIEESQIAFIESGVSLSVYKNSLSEEGVTLILKNDNKSDVLYTEYYELEIRKNSEWYKVDIPVDFVEISTMLESGKSTDIMIDWDDYYDILKPGTYRIIKEIMILNDGVSVERAYVSVEFVI